MTTLEEFQGLRVYRVLKRIGEQPTREKEWDILKRIAERNQIQIRIAVLAQGERERVLRIRTDREGRGLARSAWARRERLGTMTGVIGWGLRARHHDRGKSGRLRSDAKATNDH